MVGNTKRLSEKWKFGSPKGKIARTPAAAPNTNKEGSNTSDQTHRMSASTDSQGTEVTPEPSPPRASNQLRPPSPSPSLRSRWSRPSSSAEEVDLPPERALDVGRAGGHRSRSPLLGFRKLFRLNHKGKKKSRRDEQFAAGDLEKYSSRHADTSNTIPPRNTEMGEPASEPLPEGTGMGRAPPADQDASIGRLCVVKSDDNDNEFTREMLHDDSSSKGHTAGTKGGAGHRPPRIVYIGVFLNGIAVTLASFAPVGGADARFLVKALLLEPSASILPDSRFSSRGSDLTVHLVVDRKNRVYACVTVDDVPPKVAFSFLEEIQIEYLFRVSGLAFSTKENAHDKRCHEQLAKTWAKYEGVERTLAEERGTRRQLGDKLLDIEARPYGETQAGVGVEVSTLDFPAAAHEAAAEIAQQLRSSEAARVAARGIPLEAFSSTNTKKCWRRRGVAWNIAVALLATSVLICLVLGSARYLHFVLW